MLCQKVRNLRPSATEEIDAEVKMLKRQGIDIISLGAGEPDFDTPKNIRDAATRALNSGKTHYEPTKGDFELRKAIARKLKNDNHIDADPEDIVVTVGAKFGIYLAAQAILEKGDNVVLLDPAWVSYESIAELSEAQVTRIATEEEEGFVPDLDVITEHMDKSTKMIVVNSPCNPTGAVYPPKILKGIVEIAEDNGSYVFTDEIYEKLLYEGEFYSPGSEYENIITVNGFSKSHAMTGWRLGYVHAPKDIIEGMVKIYQHSASCVTAFAQMGALEALVSEESERFVQKMVKEYRKRRNFIMKLIEKSDIFECKKPKGAFYVFPSYDLKMKSIEFAKKLLREAHVATVPGFAFGECGEYHLRMAYTAPNEKIEEAFIKIENSLK
ncbi:MAG: pyridoxal phosphate-dependent aminotransferase [Methanomicrobia archaeon]|nr:pyridoxal phosphate-dependent aminotransferase [Methanomicrobia archaeon]